MEYNTEMKLLQGLQNGESAAFIYLREKCFESIAYLSNTISKSKEDVDDLYSEGILALIETINKPNFELTSLVKTLLVSICTNKLKDKFKSEKSRQKYLNEPYEDCYEAYLEETMDRSLYRDILMKNLKKLKKDCQEIIKKFMRELNTKEVAEDMGLTPMYVKKRKSLCHKALNAHIEEDRDYQSLCYNNEIDLT